MLIVRTRKSLIVSVVLDLFLISNLMTQIHNIQYKFYAYTNFILHQYVKLLLTNHREKGM